MQRLVTAFCVLEVGVLAACSSSIVDPAEHSVSTTGGRAAMGGASTTTSTPNGGTAQGGNSSGGTSNAGGGAGANASRGGAASGGSGGMGRGGNAGGGNANGGANGCPASQQSCSGSCVDIKTNASHCGACGQACTNGATCTNGACGCASGKMLCGTSCVDLTSDAQNCGACAKACEGGRSCQASTCQCGSGLMACESACSNLQTDAQNCGSCGTKCTLGQACVAGQCTTGAGASGADGCQGLAQNLTLSQIAVYQTVKIPIMQSGAEVAVASRKADVVAGKDAVFRLFVSVGSGFTARSLSGRIFVDNGGSVDMYYAKQNVSGSSAEGTLASTFLVNVPKEKITRTTQYQAEIVECGTGSGDVQTPRFPSTGGAALGARETGTLKIKVIPMSANSMTPDTSPTTLQIYSKLLMAMYPITSIDITVGDTISVPDAQDWTAMVDSIRAKRQTDKPASDVYYYGFLKPTATLQQYCGNGCTAGIGYVVNSNSSQAAAQRAALGLAFADNTSAQTMAHEVGHNHGRGHAPCVQGGSISGVDANYPYTNGAIGSYGWDSRTSMLIATDRTDIMGYCNNKWISDYTYDALLTRVATLNGAPMSISSIPAELIHPWHVLLLDARGPRWGAPIQEAAAPAGTAELADVLDAQGARVTSVNVYRTAISDIDAFSFEVPPPQAGWASLQVVGAKPLAYAP